MPIPPGITPDAIRQAARLIDSGAGTAFGEPTGYLAEVDGRTYAPKALVGVAAGTLPKKQELKPSEFHSGVSPGQAVHLLRKLGFTVRSRHEAQTNAYLLTWNPANWPWEELASDCERVAHIGFFRRRWSTGITRKIGPGDEVFVMRLSVEPRGIVAHGRVVSDTFIEPHWDPERSRSGDTANYVMAEFTELIDWKVVRPLPILDAPSPVLRGMNWSPQASGTSIPPPVAAELRDAWTKYIRKTAGGQDFVVGTEDVAESGLVEGAVRQITVNAYERNRIARRRCVDHWGSRCFCCGLDMGERYGPVAEGYIHVHHLKALASIGQQNSVDPVADLRPVCPNCHAVIHLTNPPTSVDELRRHMIERLRITDRNSEI